MHARTTTPEPQGSADAARERSTAAIKALAQPNTRHLTELDHQLIAAFFDPDRNLVDIARDHDLKVVALAAWSTQPHIRDILESIAELASFRAKVLSAERTALAVRTLDHCAAQVFAADMADPNTKPGARNARLGEARRAANAILRHASDRAASSDRRRSQQKQPPRGHPAPSHTPQPDPHTTRAPASSSPPAHALFLRDDAATHPSPISGLDMPALRLSGDRTSEIRRILSATS